MNIELFQIHTGWKMTVCSPSGMVHQYIQIPLQTGFQNLSKGNATLMISEGNDVCAVSKRLGHANTSTTLNVYAHALKSKDRAAADALENVLDFHEKSAEIASKIGFGGKLAGNVEEGEKRCAGKMA